MAMPKKSQEVDMDLKEKEKVLKGVTLHCKNCGEDKVPAQVRVRQAGDNRYFLFCKTCEMHMKLIDKQGVTQVKETQKTSQSGKSKGKKSKSKK